MRRTFTTFACGLALGCWMALPGAWAQSSGGGGTGGAGGGGGAAAGGGAAGAGAAGGAAQAAGGGRGTTAGQTGGAQSPAGQAQGGATPSGQAQSQGGQTPSGQARGGATPAGQAQGQQGRSPAQQAQGTRGTRNRAQGNRGTRNQAQGNRAARNPNPTQDPRGTDRGTAPDIDDRRNRRDNNEQTNRDRRDPNMREDRGVNQDNRPRTADDIQPGPSGNQRNDPIGTTPQQSQPGSGIGLPGSAQPGGGTGLPGTRDQDGRANPGAERVTDQPSFLNDQEIANELGFQPDEYRRVGQSYQQAWNRYQQARSQLGDDLSNEERSRRLSMLRDQFNRDFLDGAGQAFRNPLQQQRFRQLQMQYQGYGAFNDPTLQDDLQLSAEQIVRFNRMQEQWNQQVQQLQQGSQNSTYFRDSDAADSQEGVRQTQFLDGQQGGQNAGSSDRFQQLMRQRWQQINNILDDDQRYRYYQMVGAPHDFPMEAYLKSGGGNAGAGAAASAQGAANQGTAQNGAAAQGTAPQSTSPQSTAPQSTTPQSTAQQGTAPQGTAPGSNTPQRSATPQSSAPGTGQGGAAGGNQGTSSGQGAPRG